jgi:acylglycerol lipase
MTAAGGVVHSEQTIVSSAQDGTELYVQKWSTNQVGGGPAPAELLVVHGYLDHSNRWKEFAMYMVEHYAVNVTVFDCRGHGKSSGLRAYIEHWDLYHDDLETVWSTLPPSSSSRFLLCHSNGGLLTLDYLLLRDAEYKKRSYVLASLTGIVFTCPFLEPAGGIPWIKIYAAKALGSWLPKVKIPAPLMAEKLTKDPVKQEETRNDPDYLLYATMSWAGQSLKVQAKLAQLIKNKENNKPIFPLPLLYVYADQDVIASPAQNKSMAEALQQDDKTIVCRTGENHEVLNEVNRVDTYHLIGDWLVKRRTA